MKRILALFAVCSLCNITAFATPTTHIWGPSTDVQGFGVWHITADYYLPTEGTPAGTRIPPVTNTGLTVGVLPTDKVNAEVGIDHKSGLGGADDNPLYFNAKLGVPESVLANGAPALAIGVYDFGTKTDMTDYNIVYAKAAKTLGSSANNLGRLSVGWFAGNDQLLLDNKGEADESGLLAAWERTMPEISPKLWLCLEYMGTESGYGTMNVGGAWKFADNVGVLVGYDVFNNSDIPSTFTLQVDIDFGFKR